MADIHSKLARGYTIRKLILILLFWVFGLLSVYDGFVKYPREHEAYTEYTTEFLPLDEKKTAPGLNNAEQAQWQELSAKYPSQPKARQSRDIWLCRYIYIPICFPIGFLFLLTWLLSSRKHYTYRSDGSLICPEGEFPADRMTGLDLTRWQSKSIAKLEINGGPGEKGGQAIKLDAWIYDGLEDIIENLDKRFHPEEYETKEEPVNEKSDDETDQSEEVPDSGNDG